DLDVQPLDSEGKRGDLRKDVPEVLDLVFRPLPRGAVGLENRTTLLEGQHADPSRWFGETQSALQAVPATSRSAWFQPQDQPAGSGSPGLWSGVPSKRSLFIS